MCKSTCRQFDHRCRRDKVRWMESGLNPNGHLDLKAAIALHRPLRPTIAQRFPRELAALAPSHRTTASLAPAALLVLTIWTCQK